jgi:hypothetical protein
LDSWIGGGIYQQHGELRRIALEMALDRFDSESADSDQILFLAEQFYEFLTTGSPNSGNK